MSSSSSASLASRILRLTPLTPSRAVSPVYMLRTSCIVRVDPPWIVLPLLVTFFTAARNRPQLSTPLCSQKRRSSIATVASRITGAIAVERTGVRRMSAWMKPRREPSAA